MKTRYIEICARDEADEMIDLLASDTKRRNYQLLVKAVRVFRTSKLKGKISHFPNTPPSVSNARWNTRVIVSLFAELCDYEDENILCINEFIIQV